ncbi:MAG: 50S ribosomal protein L29 [Minisyncoccia bacterium]|jgi:ribosomal protein L29
MKKKDVQELKHRPIEELVHLITDANEKLRALKFDLAAGKVKDITEIKELKKKVARIKTFIHERANETK